MFHSLILLPHHMISLINHDTGINDKQLVENINMAVVWWGGVKNATTKQIRHLSSIKWKIFVSGFIFLYSMYNTINSTMIERYNS